MPNKFDSIRAPDIENSSSNDCECGCGSINDLDTEEISKRHVDDIIQQQMRREQELILDSQQNREQRKEYAKNIFILVCVWLFILLVVVWQTGTRYLWLSDTVIIALITGTTVNIIALMVIVANYLFPKNGR